MIEDLDLIMMNGPSELVLLQDLELKLTCLWEELNSKMNQEVLKSNTFGMEKKNP